MNNRGGDSRINEGKEEAEEKDVKFWTHTHTQQQQQDSLQYYKGYI